MSKALLIEDDEDNLFLFKTALEGSFSEIDIISHDNFTDAKESFNERTAMRSRSLFLII